MLKNQETTNCETCGISIPKERLEALPDTKTCVKHSTEEAYRGFMVYDHKTAPTLAKVKGKKNETYRRMHRAHVRAR